MRELLEIFESDKYSEFFFEYRNCSHDFSNWLTEKENLELLNEAIGLTLSEVEKEVYVGSYRCDFVGKDKVTGEKVMMIRYNYRHEMLNGL